MNFRFPAVLLFFLLIVSCKSSQHDQARKAEGKHLAYLKLDSTIVEIHEVADSLNIPWDLAADTEGNIWFTEQHGTVNRLNIYTLERQQVSKIPEVFHKKSYGLLGMALHPEFPKSPYIFLHYTFLVERDLKREEIKSRIVRYTYKRNTLSEPRILLDSIPGNTYHNGSRLAISPDRKLYFSMGDAGRAHLAQNTSVLSGKILRLNLDGSVPDDNPVSGSPVWSVGHRNPQGLAFGNHGKLYSSEHGPNNDDEINLITKAGNYGWPDVQGFCDTQQEERYCSEHEIQAPLKAWTPTIATAGLAFYDFKEIPEWQNSLVNVNLKGRAMRVLNLNAEGSKITGESIYFQKRFGRIRDVTINPGGDIYLATSNTDWHPRFQPWMYGSLPREGEDRIIRIRKSNTDISEIKNNAAVTLLSEDEEAIALSSEDWSFQVGEEEYSTGQKLYLQHCASCHAPDGKGAAGLTPPLADTDWVTGDKGRLIRVVLEGMSGPVKVNGQTYNQEMAGFSMVLNDEEVANILTYIRSSFGNSANAVIAGEVYEERKTIK